MRKGSGSNKDDEDVEFIVSRNKIMNYAGRLKEAGGLERRYTQWKCR